MPRKTSRQQFSDGLHMRSFLTVDGGLLRMDVKTKQMSFELWHAGAFGNKLRSWNSLDELLLDKYDGKVSMRYKGTITGKAFFCYEVPVKDIPQRMEQWINQGAIKQLITFNEDAPDRNLILQGEIQRDWRTYSLTYSTEKEKMRIAIKNARHASGVAATVIMTSCLDPSSWSDMQALLDIYKDHVVEFSTYSQDLGSVLGRNTIIWEVRHY
jgi:hypothetical protein